MVTVTVIITIVVIISNITYNAADPRCHQQKSQSSCWPRSHNLKILGSCWNPGYASYGREMSARVRVDCRPTPCCRLITQSSRTVWGLALPLEIEWSIAGS